MRVEQLGRIGAGAGGEQRRVLEQPHAFARAAGADRCGALFHEHERFLIRHGVVARPPFDLVRHFAHCGRHGERRSHRASVALRDRGQHNRAKPMGDSMRALSISAAWEETRAMLVRDGRLYGSVALGAGRAALGGQHAGQPRRHQCCGSTRCHRVDRLLIAHRPCRAAGADSPRARTVDDRRSGDRPWSAPDAIYLLAVLLLAIGLFVLAIPLGVAFVVLGVPITGKA